MHVAGAVGQPVLVFHGSSYPNPWIREPVGVEREKTPETGVSPALLYVYSAESTHPYAKKCASYLAPWGLVPCPVAQTVQGF